MRFCQADGTPLVDEAPIDPYKTMVATPADIAAAMPPASTESEDVLDLPASSDPAKTMYASEEEIRAEMDAHDRADEQVIDIPPLTEPEPPKFSEPTPPPSPFSAPGDIGSMTTPPIPSPFEEKPSTYEPPPPPVYEPEPVREEPAFNPFDQPQGGAMAQTEWTPPPVPDSNWQDQQIGQNTPFQPPPVGAGGQNQTLAIVSLVLGILSLFCCSWFVPGIVAIVLGFVAKGKADSDPANFGGRGLALGGIITGAVSLVLGIIVIALYFLGFLASILNQ